MHIEPALEAEPHPVQEERRYVPDVLSTREQRARLLSEEEWAIMEWQERMSNGAGISPPPRAAAAGFGGSVPPWWFPGGLPWDPQGPGQLGGGVPLEAGTDPSGILTRPPPWWMPNLWWSPIPWWQKTGHVLFVGFPEKMLRLGRIMKRLRHVIKRMYVQLLPAEPKIIAIGGGGPAEPSISDEFRSIRLDAKRHLKNAERLFWGPNEPTEDDVNNAEVDMILDEIHERQVGSDRK